MPVHEKSLNTFLAIWLKEYDMNDKWGIVPKLIKREKRPNHRTVTETIDLDIIPEHVFLDSWAVLSSRKEKRTNFRKLNN